MRVKLSQPMVTRNPGLIVLPSAVVKVPSMGR